MNASGNNIVLSPTLCWRSLHINYMSHLMPSARIELTTYSLEGYCSIQLSYEGKHWKIYLLESEKKSIIIILSLTLLSNPLGNPWHPNGFFLFNKATSRNRTQIACLQDRCLFTFLILNLPRNYLY